MEQAFENGIRYSIEFVKMLLVVVYIWKMKPKRTIVLAFPFSFFLVMLVSCFYDLSEFPLTYGITSTLIIFFFMLGKQRIGLALLSYVFISVLDMFFTYLTVEIFNIPSHELWYDFHLLVLCNSVSLLVIILYVILFRRSAVPPRISGMLLPVYILGGVAFSVFLTALLLTKSNGKALYYRNGILVGVGLAAVFFVCACILLEYNQRENEWLKTENDRNNKLLEMQSRYYLMLLEKETETKAFRHDVKEQILCMKILYENNQYDELGEYISEMQTETIELSSEYHTGNDYVNAIVTDLSRQYHQVDLEWIGRLPKLGLSYLDICTLFCNILKLRT